MANVITRAASAVGRFFGVGGGKGSRIVSQNRAARMGQRAAGRKAVRLPAAPTSARRFKAVRTPRAAPAARGG